MLWYRTSWKYTLTSGSNGFGGISEGQLRRCGSQGLTVVCDKGKMRERERGKEEDSVNQSTTVEKGVDIKSGG
jgi:hypothetical protein